MELLKDVPKVPFFYSLLIASNAFIFVALLAGYNPETIPINIANMTAAVASHNGMTDIVLAPENPNKEPNSGA